MDFGDFDFNVRPMILFRRRTYLLILVMENNEVLLLFCFLES